MSRASAGVTTSSNSQSGQPLQTRVVVRIYALLKTDIDDVVKAIENMICDLLRGDFIYNTKEDQELIAELSEEQVRRQLMSNCIWFTSFLPSVRNLELINRPHEG